ncbi:MAG: MFS transporter, partial [Proteobacteria bacterium]|nr:MFS transporter [Pseudomonadota bacterium]
LMFGVWFLANFVANLVGGYTASYIDDINASMGLSGFFMIFTAIPIAAGVLMMVISPWLRKRMHGIH